MYAPTTAAYNLADFVPTVFNEYKSKKSVASFLFYLHDKTNTNTKHKFKYLYPCTQCTKTS